MIKQKTHRKFYAFIGCFVIWFALSTNYAQQASINSIDTTHSPRKATIFSAVLPGLGQYYNKKYWKIPIVYAVIGGCLTAALINHNKFKTAGNELFYRQENSNAKLDQDFIYHDNQQLLAIYDYHRKWRDNMFLFTGLAYVLNIIDANVDAHLFNFNVDDNLAMNVVPYSYSSEIKKPVIGLTFTFSFK